MKRFLEDDDQPMKTATKPEGMFSFFPGGKKEFANPSA
jgi:hypothetical protein